MLSLSSQRYKSHLLKIITFYLLHEMRSNLHLALQHQLQTLTHRSFSHPNQVTNSHHCSQLKVGSVNEHFPLLENRSFDEPVCKPVEFFDILLRVVVEINIQILKVFGSFSVLFAGYV